MAIRPPNQDIESNLPKNERKYYYYCKPIFIVESKYIPARNKCGCLTQLQSQHTSKLPKQHQRKKPYHLLTAIASVPTVPTIIPTLVTSPASTSSPCIIICPANSHHVPAQNSTSNKNHKENGDAEPAARHSSNTTHAPPSLPITNIESRGCGLEPNAQGIGDWVERSRIRCCVGRMGIAGFQRPPTGRGGGEVVIGGDVGLWRGCYGQAVWIVCIRTCVGGEEGHFVFFLISVGGKQGD